MKYKLPTQNKKRQCCIDIPIFITSMPYSKSYLIRVMGMMALEGSISSLREWSPGLKGCDDVALMQQAVLTLLDGESDSIFVGASGAVWRFMIAIASLKTNRPIHFETSGRLAQRPILPLINQLNKWGARIHWHKSDKGIEVTVFPAEKTLSGGVLDSEIDRYTSQFRSAIMLIAPYLSESLTLSQPTEALSGSYLALTQALMCKAGGKIKEGSSGLIIQPSSYNAVTLRQMLLCPERDWSAASYLYGWVAQEKGPTTLLLEGYKSDDLQGDKRIVRDFFQLGVVTTFTAEGILLQRNKELPLSGKLQFQLDECPDLAPAYLAALLGQHKQFTLSGLARLAHKESDRFESLADLAASFGYRVTHDSDSLSFEGQWSAPKGPIHIDPISDHRIAMAATILTVATERETIILEPEVVSKSFLSFYTIARQVGFTT